MWRRAPATPPWKTSPRCVAWAFLLGTMIAYTRQDDGTQTLTTPIMKTQVTRANTPRRCLCCGGRWTSTWSPGTRTAPSLSGTCAPARRSRWGRSPTKQIKDMQLSHDGMMLITASMDTTHAWDIPNLGAPQFEKTDSPELGPPISPLWHVPHVEGGGGQGAQDVTTTSPQNRAIDAPCENKKQQGKKGEAFFEDKRFPFSPYNSGYALAFGYYRKTGKDVRGE
ncbi:Eukaryotic translation initiation factor 3 subunit I [Chionoecetes opilio]|uniref:Eukaryotic translation initiation factor 3 subunit I n=1 Tax=Chionoecetes opilio TaxID=41210 RepID=A0A8J8W9N3_CHIOP|nr:Eukaryotic translation initiation factor 3 subunit I [Chionoecetes opilio]